MVGSWIAVPYPDEVAIRDAQGRSLVQPGHLLVPATFHARLVARRLGCFFTEEAKFRRAYRSTLIRQVAQDEWLRSDEQDRLYRQEVLCGFDTSLATPRSTMCAFGARRSTFGRLFRRADQHRPGSVDVRVHSSRQGDFLRRHDDELHGRHLAFILVAISRVEPGARWRLDGFDCFAATPKEARPKR
jgi:hypothetical protein